MTPAFAAAVIIADIVGNAQPVTIDVLAVLFVTSRMPINHTIERRIAQSAR